VQIGSVVTITDLGEYMRAPSTTEILQTVNELNPNLNVNEVHIEMGAEGLAYVVVNSVSSVYAQGRIEVHYTIHK